jgi:hypothetical protein
MTRRALKPLALLAAVAVAVPGALWAWPLIGELAARTAVLPEPEQFDIVVVPHPGDELQAWSLVQHDETSYKIFVLLTRGSGRRLDGWVDRFRQLGRIDETLPTDLERVDGVRSLPDDRGLIYPTDAVTRACTRTRTPAVWADRDGRGALVALDFGADGLAPREVLWAVQVIKHNREPLGMRTGMRPGSLIAAAFSNRSYGCARSGDDDHRAVHEALYETDLHMARQLAPTCAGDPDATVTGVVSEEATSVFVGGDTRPRVHGRAVAVDRSGQRRPFHTHQTFWERFADGG